MKKIKIKMKLTNDLKEETITDVIGELDEVNKIISYYDKNVFVHVIIGEKIVMHRSAPDYDLSLIFEENKKHSSTYEIYNPKMNIDTLVETVTLRRSSNNFYVEYILRLNNENMGLFNIDFKTEE